MRLLCDCGAFEEKRADYKKRLGRWLEVVTSNEPSDRPIVIVSVHPTRRRS
jgi:hypothetical protein